MVNSNIGVAETTKQEIRQLQAFKRQLKIENALVSSDRALHPLCREKLSILAIFPTWNSVQLSIHLMHLSWKLLKEGHCWLGTNDFKALFFKYNFYFVWSCPFGVIREAFCAYIEAMSKKICLEDLFSLSLKSSSRLENKRKYLFATCQHLNKFSFLTKNNFSDLILKRESKEETETCGKKSFWCKFYFKNR